MLIETPASRATSRIPVRLVMVLLRSSCPRSQNPRAHRAGAGSCRPGGRALTLGKRFLTPRSYPDETSYRCRTNRHAAATRSWERAPVLGCTCRRSPVRTLPFAELVAIADANPGRAGLARDLVEARGAAAPAVLDPADLAAAVRSEGIDTVIVTTPDATHADFVVAALDAGADAIVEKPLTTTVEGVRRIAEAAERTGRSVTVTFNYRYSPRNTALKSLIASRRDRAGHERALRVGARHRPRRRLLPPLAPREGQLRRAAHPQGIAPLRPGQLVDRRRAHPRLRVGRPAVLRRPQRRRTRPRGAPRARDRSTRPCRTHSASTCAREPR